MVWKCLYFNLCVNTVHKSWMNEIQRYIFKRTFFIMENTLKGKKARVPPCDPLCVEQPDKHVSTRYGRLMLKWKKVLYIRACAVKEKMHSASEGRMNQAEVWSCPGTSAFSDSYSGTVPPKQLKVKHTRSSSFSHPSEMTTECSTWLSETWTQASLLLCFVFLNLIVNCASASFHPSHRLYMDPPTCQWTRHQSLTSTNKITRQTFSLIVDWSFFLNFFQYLNCEGIYRCLFTVLVVISLFLISWFYCIWIVHKQNTEDITQRREDRNNELSQQLVETLTKQK